MKRLTWVLAAAMTAAVALPAFAGGKGEKCSQDAQTCLNHFSAKKSKGWVGIEIDKTEASQVVKNVVTDGPGAAAGFEIGDVLVARNGIKVTDYEALKADKGSWDVGALVTYTVLRHGKEKKLAVKLAPIPDDVFARMVGMHMVSDHLAENTMASTEATPAEKAAAVTKAADAKK